MVEKHLGGAVRSLPRCCRTSAEKATVKLTFFIGLIDRHPQPNRRLRNGRGNLAFGVPFSLEFAWLATRGSRPQIDPYSPQM